MPLQTYLFHISGLKPAQDPWQFVHSGEGCAFDPHRLKQRNVGVKNKESSDMNL